MFEDLSRAQYIITEKKAKFLCTDNEKFYITKNKELRPGTGWIVSSITYITGRKPYVIGKPNKNLIIDFLENNLKVKKAKGVVIGDSLSSDILLGKKCGFLTFLVLGGVTSMDKVKSLKSNKPDFIVENFFEVIGEIRKRGEWR